MKSVSVTNMATNSLKRINKNENIDEIRQRNIAYEYLCHLEEAKIWIESCIKETLPPSTELEANLRNGVVLAKLGHYLKPELVPTNKIYDADYAVFSKAGLRFRHTDNINYFIKAVTATELPKTFLPETVDVYEAKNLPRLIYCVHALSRHLFRTGHAPLIPDLFGKVAFSESDIDSMRDRLDSVNFVMPSFGKLSSLIATDKDHQCGGGGANPLASLKAINEAIQEKNTQLLRSLLKPPAYHTIDTLFSTYATTLYTALADKLEQLQNHSLNESFEPDEYSELLTQTEIQGYLSQINIDHVWELLVGQGGQKVSVWETLRHQHVNIQNLVRDHEPFYQAELAALSSQQPARTSHSSLPVVHSSHALNHSSLPAHQFLPNLSSPKQSHSSMVNSSPVKASLAQSSHALNHSSYPANQFLPNLSSPKKSSHPSSLVNPSLINSSPLKAASLAPHSSLPPNEKLALLQKAVYRGNEKALGEKQRAEVLRQMDSLLGRLVEVRRRHAEEATEETKPESAPQSPALKPSGLLSSSNLPGYLKPWCASGGSPSKKWASVSATRLHGRTATSGDAAAENRGARNASGTRVNFKACLNELFELLSHEAMGLKGLDKFSLPLYMEDLLEEKQHAGTISYPRLGTIIAHAHTVANVSKSLDTPLAALFWDALAAPQLQLRPELEPQLRREYCNALKACRQFKEMNCSPGGGAVLNLANIRKCVQMVNAEHNLQSKTLDTILEVNNILHQVHTRRQLKGSGLAEPQQLKPLLDLLNEPCLGLTDLSELSDHELLVNLLAEKMEQRSASSPEPAASESEASEAETREAEASAADTSAAACLWLEDIQDSVQQALLVVQNIRLFLESEGKQLVVGEKQGKKSAPLAGQDVEDKENRDLMNLSVKRSDKERAGDWEVYNIASRNVYLNLKTGQYRWTPPPSSKASSSTKPRRSLDSSHIYRNINEVLFVKLQARCRGYLARREFLEKYLNHLEVQAAVKIQRWWRRALKDIERQRFIYRQKALRKASSRSTRGAPVKRKREDESFPDRMAYYAKNVDSIVKVQSLWRGKLVRSMYMMLFSGGKDCPQGKLPTFKMLKRFIEHLDTNIQDYHTAIELQRMRTEISKLFIKNKTLSKILEDLDLKIFLLVQNRLSLSDILKCKSDLQLAADVDCATNTQAKNSMMEKYAYLLYILQVRAEYLVRLILSVPHTTLNFLQGITLTIYNSGHTSRDEYMMLRCLSLLLREELMNSDKYTKPVDIITTPPVAMKIIMHYAREKCGNMSLKTILKSLIEKILKENSVIAYTNPITIYNKWRGELEFTTGKASELPAVVDDVNAALAYDHVTRTLASGIQKLESTTNMFLKRIVASKEYIPYGLLYMISTLREIMLLKFGDGKEKDENHTQSQPRPSLYPDLHAMQSSSNIHLEKVSPEYQQHVLEKDIVKVIGHYLYYNFINSAIVAPEAYKIVSLRPGQEISTEQRHNLATVAKLLQFSAAKKGYGEESSYLMCLNKFITYCHDRLRQFFDQCCQVPSLEEYYGINEYSEELLATPPTIYTNLGDLFEFHSLLLSYKYDVCSDSEDVLLKLLHELNSPSLVYKAAGIAESDISPQTNKTPLSFVLTIPPKTSSLEASSEEENIAKLFIQTKELLVVVLPCLGGHTLPGALRMDHSADQEAAFRARITRLAQYNEALTSLTQLTLKSAKVKLRKYLSTLEQHGYVSRETGYQEIISKLIQDINNKNKYRQMQSRELRTVRETRNCLLEKIETSAEKISYYEKYIASCLQNQTLSKRNVHLTICSNDKKLQNKLIITYTGKQLFDKGILVEAEGLSEKQLKNILIEFKPKETYGSFQINGKFMGVQMESTEINIQDLLQKKFLGISIMDIFGKTKVNVNLLLHLLNKKYYSKH